MEALEETWRNLQKIIRERDAELAKEALRQEDNDKLRIEFAKHANNFHAWLTETRSSMMECSGTLEEQPPTVLQVCLSTPSWKIWSRSTKHGSCWHAWQTQSSTCRCLLGEALLWPILRLAHG